MSLSYVCQKFKIYLRVVTYNIPKFLLYFHFFLSNLTNIWAKIELIRFFEFAARNEPKGQCKKSKNVETEEIFCERSVSYHSSHHHKYHTGGMREMALRVQCFVLYW